MSRSKLIIFLILVSLLIAGGGILLINQQYANSPKEPISTPTPHPESSSPTVVSTKPDPLEGAVIPANQVIEITFSHPLENDPEFRRRFDPEIEYKLELSADKKMVRFIPVKLYELGVGYTLFILPDTKFVGGGKLDGEKTYHFNTIKYRGV